MIIREWQREDLQKGLLETLENLKPVGILNSERTLEIFKEMSENSVYLVLVAEDESQIVGAATLLLERKFIRGGGLAGHIEDVVVRRGFEGRWIGSALVKKAVLEAKRRGCYKVVLDCDEQLVPFYRRQGFEEAGVFMRLYL